MRGEADTGEPRRADTGEPRRADTGERREFFRGDRFSLEKSVESEKSTNRETRTERSPGVNRKTEEDQFIKRIQDEDIRAIAAEKKKKEVEGGRIKEDMFPPSLRDLRIVAEPEEEIPVSTFDEALNVQTETVLPETAFKEISEDKTVLPATTFNTILPAEKAGSGLLSGDALIKGSFRGWDEKKRGKTNWKRILELPPLKRAIVVSELLGPPRGFREGTEWGD
jgi:hypothetical protein